MSSATIPMEVLSRQLGDAIAGRRVRAGCVHHVHVRPGLLRAAAAAAALPRFLIQPTRQGPSRAARRRPAHIRAPGRLLATVRPLLRTANQLSSTIDASTSGGGTGCFHPKLVLLLVDDHHGEDEPVEPVRQALNRGIAVGQPDARRLVGEPGVRASRRD